MYRSLFHSELSTLVKRLSNKYLILIKIISHNRYKVVYYKVVVFERVSNQLLKVLGTKQHS